MAASKDLVDRIDAEFSAAEKRVNELQARRIQEFHGHQQRLEMFSKTLHRLRGIWWPRLEALAEKFGKRVDVEPHIEPGQRSATFEFKSELAHIRLRFGVSPDSEVNNLIFTYDLDIIPILMKFDSHDEIEMPLEAVDEEALGKWMDDRIVSFVQTYLSLHENKYYLKDHMVEDPIAKVKFPKYAAGAQLDVDGKTVYFLDESTRREFEHKQAAKK